MPFTGKATYTAGAGLPEVVEDVSDIIGIVSPSRRPCWITLATRNGPAPARSRMAGGFTTTEHGQHPGPGHLIALDGDHVFGGPWRSVPYR